MIDPMPETGHARIPLSDLRPAPENDFLYGWVDPTDSEVRKLAKDLEKRGILEPIVVSIDRVIISGHRRSVAARLAGLSVVPCIIQPVRYASDRDQFLELLRAHNLQRVKTADTLIKEEVYDASKGAEARRRLIEHRRAVARPEGLEDLAIAIKSRGQRAEISPAKMPMLVAAEKVILTLRQYWPLTVRQVHYWILNDPPLRHAGKPDSLYRNDRASYSDATDLLLRARLSGRISWEAITDETRPVEVWDVHPHVGAFVRKECDGFLTNYWRDLQRSQPYHLEILGEKNTVGGILRPVAQEYTITITLGRGYSSGTPRYEMLKRFQASGKDTLALLVMSDFDPEGEDIPQAFASSLVEDFGISRERIRLVKVALTHEHVLARNLPTNFDAKTSSSRYAEFSAKYGDAVYELEALQPADLQGLLREAIDSVMDVGAYRREQVAEQEDAFHIEQTRARVFRAISPLIDHQRRST